MILGDVKQPMHYHVRSESPPFHKEVIDTLLNLEPGDKLAVVALGDMQNLHLFHLFTHYIAYYLEKRGLFY